MYRESIAHIRQFGLFIRQPSRYDWDVYTVDVWGVYEGFILYEHTFCKGLYSLEMEVS
jgi:hypothetical protein